MKRILFLIACISLIPASFTEADVSDKNAQPIQTAKDGNIPAVQTKHREYEFPLHSASAKGDIEKVKELIAKGYDINIRDDVNYTPLHNAVQFGHKKVAELLVAHGADVNAENNIGAIPIMLALLHNHKDIAEMLIANGAKRTIYVAVVQGDVESVKVFLKKDPNLINTLASNDGWSALQWAAYMDQLDVIKVLIENRANVNIRSRDRVTPLYWAVRRGNINAAKILIENGADVNIKLIHGEAILHSPGTLETARLLVDNGANVNAKDDYGRTPLHIIAGNPPSIIQRVLFWKNGGSARTWETDFEKYRGDAEKVAAEIAELLIKNGADVNAKRTDDGATALILAAQEGRTEVVKLLLDKGADVNAKRTTNGETALGAAKRTGHIDIVRLLEKAGAKE